MHGCGSGATSFFVMNSFPLFLFFYFFLFLFFLLAGLWFRYIVQQGGTWHEHSERIDTGSDNTLPTLYRHVARWLAGRGWPGPAYNQVCYVVEYLSTLYVHVRCTSILTTPARAEGLPTLTYIAYKRS